MLKTLRIFAVLLIGTLALCVPSFAQSQEDAPRKITIQYYFFSAEDDAALTPQIAYRLEDFNKILTTLSNAKKLQIFSTESKTINVGEMFEVSKNGPTPGDREVVQIPTSDFGDTGKIQYLVINAVKNIGQFNWTIRTDFTLGNDQAMILGGFDRGDVPETQGRKKEKQRKIQHVYFAVVVKAGERN